MTCRRGPDWRKAAVHVDDAHFDDVAGFGAAYKDRAGANMHTETFAGAASQKLAVDRSGAAAVHALLVFGPKINALNARIAFDHALGVVAGVVGYGFDGDVVAGIDFKLRL
jgi:hypothetical protein